MNHAMAASSSPLTLSQAPKFPKRLPNVDVNTSSFEMGFEEELVDGGLDNVSMCAICRGFPRHPANIDKCGHLFCEKCIKKHFTQRATSQHPWITVMVAPCPTCMQPFRMGEILPWTLWQRWAELAYNVHVV